MAATPEPAVKHPRIVVGAVTQRAYQVAIAHEAVERNTMVILPTGMGKTVVALLVIAERIERVPGKVLLLAPTKPLVEQHARFFEESLVEAKVEVFTGETPPEARELAFRDADVVCSTPQVVRNDLVAGRIDLAGTTLVVFDEAHRATGNYAYGFIADAYRRQRLDGRVLAMTASPGADADKVRAVCETLGIDGVEVRTELDEDTRDYVQDTDVEWKQVAVPETLRRMADLLREMEAESVQAVRAAGAIPPYIRHVGKKALLDAQKNLQARMRHGEQDPLIFKALSAQAAALKVGHALELAETQGVAALTSYLDKLRNDDSKAAKRILADPRFVEVQRLIQDARVEHPKLRQVAILLRQQLREKPDARVIVFTNYRDTAETLVRELERVDGVRPARFVGQASRSETDRGLSQKKQVEMVERFKEGEFNVLVATSVAEEGLDIPATDLVIFFEPVPSEIRAIQRRGRTGRRRAGRVVILITKDTRDETYHWASRAREKKMKKETEVLRRHFEKVNASQGSDAWQKTFGDDAREERPLETFTDLAKTKATKDAKQGPVTIVTDHREFNSTVVQAIARRGVVVKPEALDVADYVLSDRLAVERKESGDFAASLMDGRLFEQARALRDAYSAPMMIIEGASLTAGHRISDDAAYAALASLLTDYHITAVTTRDAEETALLLTTLARREQRKEKREVALRGGTTAMSDEERLRYVVEGLPHVSAVLGRRLLDHFGTLREIANANVEDLQEVEGVGPRIAQDIHRILRTEYVGRAKK